MSNGNQTDEVFKFNIRKSIRAKGRKPQVQTRALSATLNLKTYNHIVQFIDPNGANRDVYLPETELSGSTWVKYPKDIWFVIFNLADASESLVIKWKYIENGSPTTNTILTLNKDEGGIFFSNGEIWVGFKGGKT